MKRIIFIYSLSALMIAFIMTDVFALSGTITKVQGSVLLINGRSQTYARAGSIVNKGTIIKTGFRSYAWLQIDRSATTVGPLSRVSVNNLIDAKGTNPARIQLNLRRGSLRALVKDLKNENRKKISFKVRTPVSVASVRGTEIEVSHGPGMGSMVRFLTGHGEFADAVDRKRNIHKGQQSTVSNNKGPTSTIYENRSKSQVNLSNGYTNDENDSRNNGNSNDFGFGSQSEDPLKEFDNIVKDAKKTTVKFQVEFRR